LGSPSGFGCSGSLGESGMAGGHTTGLPARPSNVSPSLITDQDHDTRPFTGTAPEPYPSAKLTRFRPSRLLR
jgi:hypothetical protein